MNDHSIPLLNLEIPYEGVHCYAAEHNFEELEKLIKAHPELAKKISKTGEDAIMCAIAPDFPIKDGLYKFLHLFRGPDSSYTQNKKRCIDLLMQHHNADFYDNANKCTKPECYVRSALATAIDALDLKTAIKLIKNGAPITYGRIIPDTQLLSRLFSSASYITNSMKDPQKLKEVLGKDVTEEEIKLVDLELKKDIKELISLMLEKNRSAIFSKDGGISNADSFQTILNSPCFSIDCCEFITKTLTKLMEPGDVNWHHKDCDGDTVWTLALQVYIRHGCDSENLLQLLYEAGAWESLLSTTDVLPGRSAFPDYREALELKYGKIDRTADVYAQDLVNATPYYISLLKEDISKKQVALDLLKESHKGFEDLIKLLSYADLQSLTSNFKSSLLGIKEEKDEYLLVLNCTEALKSAVEKSFGIDGKLCSCISGFIHNFKTLMSNKDDEMHLFHFITPEKQKFFKSLITNAESADHSKMVQDFVKTLEKCLSACCQGLKVNIEAKDRDVCKKEAAKPFAEKQLEVMHTLVKKEKQRRKAPSPVVEGEQEGEAQSLVLEDKQEDRAPSPVFEGASASGEGQAVSTYL